MTVRIKFTKMHGAGNDYIYVDTTRYPIAESDRMEQVSYRNRKRWTNIDWCL